MHRQQSKEHLSIEALAHAGAADVDAGEPGRQQFCLLGPAAHRVVPGSMHSTPCCWHCRSPWGGGESQQRQRPVEHPGK